MIVAVLLGINGDLGSAIMMSNEMTLLALIPVYKETWPDALATLVVVHPIKLDEGENDYIAVVMNATMCHTELCANAQDKGLQFPNGFANGGEDVIDVFKTVEVAMEQVNKECVAASKPNKQARTKKSDVVVGAQDIGEKKAITRESSWPKRKSTSASGEREASKGKKPKGKLTLEVNNFTSKMKPFDVEAMYKSLEDGLAMLPLWARPSALQNSC